MASKKPKTAEHDEDAGEAQAKPSPVQRILGPLTAIFAKIRGMIPVGKGKDSGGDFDATIEAAKKEEDWPDESEIPRGPGQSGGRLQKIVGMLKRSKPGMAAAPGPAKPVKPANPIPLIATWVLVILLSAGSATWVVMRSGHIDTVPGTAVTIEVPKRVMSGAGKDPFADVPAGSTRDDQQAGTVDEKGKPKATQRRLLPSRMVAAPDPGLHQDGPDGPIPLTPSDGRTVAKVYAAPFEDPLNRPRIAIILLDMGLNQSATIAAIQRLPPTINFAFTPYAGNVGEQSEASRAAGHEVLIQLPMEPNDYPASDPGPYAVMTGYKPDENLRRIEWVLGRFAGYVGAINMMGSKITSSPEELRPALEALKQKGMVFVDTRATQRSIVGRMAREVGLPVALNNRFIDQEASRAAIDARLEELERLAKANGVSVGVARPYPVTIDRLEKWAQAVGPRNIALAPITAVVGKQKVD